MADVTADGPSDRIAIDGATPTPTSAIKGRGAISNAESRFLPTRSIAVDDGWYLREDSATSAPATQFYPDRTRTLITRNKSPDLSFEQSINPYKGCEHGCVYCYARPTHAYLDLSPGLDFETRIFFKTDTAEHLRKELGAAKYRCSVLAIGTNTDPYQPGERRLNVMREILGVLHEHKHPLSIVTKSALILRDLELLRAMAADNLVHVYVSITTLDKQLKRQLEPRTADPGARLRAVRELHAAGVPTGVMMAPIIPFINDAEIEDVVARSVEHGARVVRYVLLRLPLEVRGLFEEWLQTHYPLRAQRVMAAVRATRGGRDYDAQWFKRMVGQGPVAQLIQQRMSGALRRAGIVDAQMPVLRTDLFVPPREETPQLSLF
ncbi:MAG: PA0069 family radical SAM protein [Pseudomonadota bacterium]